MNLKQLQLVCTMVQADFNVSKTANIMHTTQPGISALLKSLEDELNVKLFNRLGKRITGLTDAGHEIHTNAQQALINIKSIKDIGLEYSGKQKGSLAIATTHTQARYVLPQVINKFAKRYPKIQLKIRQGTPKQIAQMVTDGEADFAIATESIVDYQKLAIVPVYEWNRCILTPKTHPLVKLKKKITLKEIAAHPIITYDFAFAGRSVTQKAFSEKNLTPNVVLTALDSDVIKTYVELDLGIGLLAAMAYNKKIDTNLHFIEASHLFENSTTFVGFRKGQFLRQYIIDFLLWLAPHITYEDIVSANEGN